jgi:hypothetical protein
LTGGFDEILSQLMGEVTDELLQARAFKTKVQPEIDDDFPTLHAHSLLGLWGALESLVEDLFMGMLSLKPTLLQNEQFSRFKLPITAMAGPEDARSQSILDAVAKDLGTNLLTGAGQFEALLKHVGSRWRIDRQVASRACGVAKDTTRVGASSRHSRRTIPDRQSVGSTVATRRAR